MSDVKRMPISEFRDLGYLQEVNRQFFHPLGLALEVVTDESGNPVELGGIWDYRDDPEGMLFGDLPSRPDALEKAGHVAAERRRHVETRTRLFGRGSLVEPLDWTYPDGQ